MKNVVLIPDSFKGTLTSEQVCAVMRAAVLRRWPDCRVHEIPMADGGEGTVAAFLASTQGEGSKMRAVVQGVFGEAIETEVGVIEERGVRTAVIETASCAGLSLVKGAADPMRATTYGVGQLVSAALEARCRKILIGLGGSATNDGGCGLAAALGVKFYNEGGGVFIPTGGTLSRIARIDVSDLDKRVLDAEIIGLCDVKNPLYGPEGAAYIFAPQKGATSAEVEVLDAGLRHLALVTGRDLGLDKAWKEGAGAAGGCGYGLKVFLNAHLQSGIDTLLAQVRFEDLLKETDCIFTGEGRLDKQSLMGKAVGGIAARCKKAQVPLIAVAGSIDGRPEDFKRYGITAVFTPDLSGRRSFEEIKKHAGEDLACCMSKALSEY